MPYRDPSGVHMPIIPVFVLETFAVFRRIGRQFMLHHDESERGLRRQTHVLTFGEKAVASLGGQRQFL